MQKENHRTIIHYALGVHLNTPDVIIKYLIEEGMVLYRWGQGRSQNFMLILKCPLAKQGTGCKSIEKIGLMCI